jgi:hypothetical protein
MDREVDIFALVDNPNVLPLDGTHPWDDASVQRALNIRGNSALVHYAICEAVMPSVDARELAALLCKHDQKTLLFIAKSIVGAHKLLTNVGHVNVDHLERYKMIDLRTALDRSIVDAKVKHVPVHGTFRDMVASGVVDQVHYEHSGDASTVSLTLRGKPVLIENGFTVHDEATVSTWDSEVFAYLNRKAAGDGVGSVQELPAISFMVAGGPEIVNGSLSNARSSLVVDAISKTISGFSYDLAKGTDAVAKAIYDRHLKLDPRLDLIRKSVYKTLEDHLPQDKFRSTTTPVVRMVILKNLVKKDSTNDVFAEFNIMRTNSQRARSGYDDVGKNAVSWDAGRVHPSIGVFEKQYIALSASRVPLDSRVLFVGVGKRFHAYDAIKAYGLQNWKAIDIIEFEHREKQNIICGDFFKQDLSNYDYVFSDGFVPPEQGKGKGTKHDPHGLMMCAWSFVKQCFVKKVKCFTCKVVVPASMFLASLPEFFTQLFGSYEILNISPGACIHSGEHYITFNKIDNDLSANQSYNAYIAFMLPVIQWATYANWARNTCLAYGIGLDPSLFLDAKLACFGRSLFGVHPYTYREISTVAHHTSLAADQFVFDDLVEDEEIVDDRPDFVQPTLAGRANERISSTIKAGTLYQPSLGTFQASDFALRDVTSQPAILPLVDDARYYTNVGASSSSSSYDGQFDTTDEVQVPIPYDKEDSH